MRVKYTTRGIVLARTHVGEANTLVAMLTEDVGLVFARAQSLRKPGAKLAAALATFAESELVLVRGKEGWRVAGAVLGENWFQRLPSPDTRAAAARVSGLLLRLVAGEAQDSVLFPIVRAFLISLTDVPPEQREAAEILAVLRLLAALGLDSGPIPGERAEDFSRHALSEAFEGHAVFVKRINAGIAASGL